MSSGPITYRWRGEFSNREINRLHGAAFGTRVFDESEWDWQQQVAGHSLGWVTARQSGALVGFVNVIWDGFVHAWIQDVMVSPGEQRSGIGVRLVHAARDAAKDAGCEWLHVDFDDEHRAFYIDACGFKPTGAGLMDLS